MDRWTKTYNNLAEVDEIILNIKEMQDKILDIYSPDCAECVNLLRNLNELKEEAKNLYLKLQKNF